jgi:hypothetical protein
MTEHQTFLILGALAVIGLLTLLATARRRARKAADVARDSFQAASLLGRVLITAGVIAGSQFAVIRYAHNFTLLVCVLVVPALLAAATAVKALTVTPTTIRKGR